MISEEIRIVKDGETLRTLESYMGNKANQMNQILKKQNEVLNAWKTLNLSISGKELILKSLVQSRALFLATVNRMPKDIQKRIEKQMKDFIWNDKKATMNWKEVSQPREIGGLNMPNIETRIEAQIIWLKKYLAPKNERPDWAYVVDQIIFNNLQKTPKIAKENKISWIFQLWNKTGKKDTIPKFVNEMIKVDRKYKVEYDILEAGPKPRKLLPIWHHIGIEDNYSWNKKLVTCLRKEHKIVETGRLEEFTKGNSTHWFCKRLAKKIIDKITEHLRPGKEIN